MAGVVKKWPVPDFPPESLGSIEAVASSNPEAIFSALSVLIATVPRDPNMILSAIARGAQSMTRSSGAAIAMRRDGVVICLGRSGETAPALGTLLGVDSGISGECLRIGKSLLCDDTSTDSRADAEVCRRFGLRSIAAVPLVQRGETVGILEAFSTQPHAFAEEHMDSLMRLAELAEAAASEEADPQTQPAKSAGLSQLRHAIASSWENSPQLERRQRYHVVGVALAVLFLLSVVGWRVRHNSANGIASSQQLAAARNMQPITNKETPSITSGPALVLKPSPDHLSIQSNKPLVPRTAQPVSSTEVADSASRFRNAPAAVSPADVPPVPTNSSAGTAELVRLLSAPATLPSFRPLGFSGGVLVYKIQPLYPPQALLWRLGGTVVLQATIAEDGTVRDLKVMSGNPMLAGAAIEAVSHWRYRPLLLNGRPIQNQERISIDFKLPH